MRKIIIIPKEELEEMYINQRLSAEKISKRYNCSDVCILCKLKKYEIPIFQGRGRFVKGQVSAFKGKHFSEEHKRKSSLSKLGRVLPEKEIIDSYVNKKISSNQLAKIYNCSSPTILNILERKNIPRRKHSDYEISLETRKQMGETRKKLMAEGIIKSPNKDKHLSEKTKRLIAEYHLGKYKIIIPKEKLVELYLNKKLNAEEISKLYKCTIHTILRRLREYKIPRRKASEFNKGKIPWNKDKTGIYTKEVLNKISERTRLAMQDKSVREKIDNFSSKRRDKSFEEYYGNERAREIRDKFSKARIGDKNPMFGKKRPDTTKRNIENPSSRIPSVAKKISIAQKISWRDNPQIMENWKERRKNIIIPVKDTSIEVKIQNFLKTLRIEFLTHQYIKDIEHGYQCDILIPSMNLVIECDGDAFHFNPKKYKVDDRIFKNGMNAQERWNLDNTRTKELIEKGYKVIRLWGSEIKVMKLEDFNKKLTTS